MPQYLTTTEVADILSVDAGKVRAWLDDGSLIGVNIARNAKGIRPRWRVSREALDQFIDQRQSQGGTDAHQR